MTSTVIVLLVVSVFLWLCAITELKYFSLFNMYLPKHVYIIDILLYSDNKYSTAYLENLVPMNTSPNHVTTTNVTQQWIVIIIRLCSHASKLRAVWYIVEFCWK